MPHYKPSRYNIYYLLSCDDKSVVFVWNSLYETGAFLPVHVASGLIEGKLSSVTTKNFGELLSHRFLVPEELDELDAYLSKWMVLRHSRKAPFTLTIVPTFNCSLFCDYCYQRRNLCFKPEWDMDKKVEGELVGWVGHLLKELRYPRFFVAWYGGEPLLRWHTIKGLSKRFMEVAKSLGCEYGAFMVTNGLSLTEKVSSKLPSLGVRGVQVTLEMPPEKHDERRTTRRGTNILPKLLENIKKAAKHVHVNIRLNIDEKDVEDQTIERIVSFLEVNRLTKNSNFSISPALIEHWYYQVGTLGLCFSETTDHWERREETYKKLLSLEWSFKTPMGDPSNPKRLLHRLMSGRLYAHCSATSPQAFIVLPDGRLTKCWETIMDEKRTLGRVGEGVDIYSKEWIRWATYNPLKTKECKNCVLLPICGGRCANHRLQKVPPSLSCRRDLLPTIQMLAEKMAEQKFGWKNVTSRWLPPERNQLPAYLKIGSASACNS